MAWFGHSGSHTSQLMHSSVMKSAMSLKEPRRESARRLDAELLRDMRVHELRHVAAETGDLANDRRRNEHVLLVRCQEQCFDVRIQVPVHSGHLELVLEI